MRADAAAVHHGFSDFRLISSEFHPGPPSLGGKRVHSQAQQIKTMNKNDDLKFFIAVLFAVAALLSEKASGQTNGLTASVAGDFIGPNAFPTNIDSGWETMLNSSYTAPSAAKFQGTRLGNSDAFDVNIGVGKKFTLNDKWFLQLDFGSDNLFLDTVAGAPIPDAVHTMRFGAGIGYHLNDKWTVTGMVNPTLYSFDDIQCSDVGISGGLLAFYRANSKLTWSFGIMVAPDSDLPVLPMAGVNWMINNQFTLQMMFPKPRLLYQINRQLTLYAGLDMVGTTFRTSDNFGTKIGMTEYNDALATYRDVRLGLGVGYHIISELNAELEAGASVYRQIDYTKLDQQVKFNPSAYVRFALNYRF